MLLRKNFSKFNSGGYTLDARLAQCAALPNCRSLTINQCIRSQ
ncbi:MAG TPA: hypothetical protein PLB89_06710 [Flavobacteriales bacterium]|nr:hypothetical protein [Flavobacteriales bacterium]